MTEFGIYCMESVGEEIDCFKTWCSLHKNRKLSEAKRIRYLNVYSIHKDKAYYCFSKDKNVMIKGFIRRKDENTKDSV